MVITDDHSNVHQSLKASNVYFNLKRAAYSANPSSVSSTHFKKDVINKLHQIGISKQLQNALALETSLHKERRPHSLQTYVDRAQSVWEKRILKSLNTMCTELSVSLAHGRSKADQLEMRANWAELSDIIDPTRLESYRPVYGPKDFLEVVSSLSNPNLLSHSHHSFWGLVQVPVNVPSLDQLRHRFAPLSLSNPQSGLDDDAFDWAAFRDKHLRRVVAAKDCLISQAAAAKGLSVGSRGDVWCSALNVAVDDVDRMYYNQLKHQVILHDLMIDNVIVKDIRLTAVNDDFYFVFEDYLYQTLLVFSRDTEVLKLCDSECLLSLKGYLRGKLGNSDYSVLYPPNGVVPFHGFAMLLAPLGFLYTDPVTMFFVFRQLHVRYFSYLHSLSLNENGIISVSACFESLLSTLQPTLFLHLRSIGAQPLKMAFKWLMRAFSGYLESDQLLVLWDRIIAFETNLILSVLATGIFIFRMNNLMAVKTASAAESIMSDLSTIRVIPILQITLTNKLFSIH